MDGVGKRECGCVPLLDYRSNDYGEVSSLLVAGRRRNNSGVWDFG
jgi:hypothetical protein